MAQTGYTPIQLYYSSTATNIPSASNLASGELAINIADGKLYFKNSSNAVTLLAQSSAANPVTTISFGSTGLTPSTATSGAVTVAGTLAATSGGTGLSTYATGDVIYASASNTLSKLAAGTNGQVLTLASGVPSWSTPASGGVTTISFGSTGLTPSTATSGAVSVAGTLAVANGGTGVTTSTGTGAGVHATSPTLVTPVLGTPTSVTLTNATGLPLTTGVTGTLPIGNGGTNLTTYTTGDVLYASATNTIGKLAIGTAGQVLTVSGGTVAWATPAAGGVTSITGTANQVIASASTGAITLSTPQSIGTASSVQFGSFGVGTAASGTTGEIRATNNITAYYSDDRLKTKLGNIPNAVDKVFSLSGFYYEANEIAQALGYEVKKEVGVSAQEVQKIMPEVVAPAPIDDKYLTVRYERLVPLLIEAIKELTQRVVELEKAK
jgi:hypothetical protein